MATPSGNRTWDQTRNELISAALRKLGVLDQGESVTAGSDMESEAVIALNTLVKSWHTRGLRLWTQTQYTQTMTASTISYTLSTDILSVESAGIFLRRSGSNGDDPITLISLSEYDEIADKSSTGQPLKIAIDYQLASTTMYVWPSPHNSTDTIYFRGIRKLQDFTASGDGPDTPPRWYKALVYGLAADLALEYHRGDLLKALTITADKEFNYAKGFDNIQANSAPLNIRPARTGRRRV